MKIAIGWLKEIFIPECNKSFTPTLLVVDGHKTHCTLEFMWECHQNNIIVLYLPPHSSHVTQPLDLSCFSGVKQAYRSEVAELAQWEDSQPIKKIHFCDIYQKARTKGLIITSIQSGWKAAGLVPFNPDKVYGSRLAKAGRSEPITPTLTGPQTPQKASKASSETWLTTPQNLQQLTVSIHQIQATFKVNRLIRTFFPKIQKAMGHSHASEAKAIYNYKGLQAKLATVRKIRPCVPDTPPYRTIRGVL